MSDSPALELIGVHKSFPGVVALDGVSLALQRGRIHALLGENGAGKSTLIGALSGILAPEAGELSQDGRRALLATPQDARQRGIITVHQEGNLFPDLSVAENLGLEYGWFSPWGLIDWPRLHQRTRQCLTSFGSRITPGTPAESLTAGQRQLVAVAAALGCDASVLILDEPTSSLSRAETVVLFKRLRHFREAGGAVLYVSHRLEEVFELADEATVLRDGRRVWSGPLAETNTARLVAHMVGRETPAVVRSGCTPGPVRLISQGLTDRDGRFRDISLEVRAGEVLGLYGLVGAGRSEWAQGVLGLRPLAAGQVLLDGQRWIPSGPAAAARRGLIYLPEDRLRLGLFSGLSVLANAVIAVLRRLTRWQFVRPAEEQRVAEQVVRGLTVRLRSLHQQAATLSGGNQQKVILGRWLSCEPSVLLLDEPTRGVDIGAKEELHAELRRLAASGRAIVLISSDLTEVLTYSDRIGVFCDGRLTAEFDARTTTPDRVAHAALPVRHEEPTDQGSSVRPSIRGAMVLCRDAAPLLAAIVLAVLLAWRTDTFLQSATLTDVASSTALLALCGLGAALVILAGGIDISFGAVMALSAAVAGCLMRDGWPPALAALVAILVGASAGATNAALTLAARVHPIVITLGTVSLYRGLTIRLVGARAIDEVPEAFRDPWRWAPLGVPVGVWVTLITISAAWWLLSHTVAGRCVLAVGSNPQAAERVGISRSRVWLAVYSLQGALAALAGLQALAMTGHLQARDFEETTLEAIGVAVVGGVAITGGRGSVWGVLAAALLFRILDKGWALLHVPAFWQRTVVGGLLLLAILGDRLWRGRR